MNKLRYWFEDTAFYRHFWSAVTHPRNYLFCRKYPFWKSRNVWTGRFSGYQFTMYEWIPDGWRKAFGPQLTEDIAAALKADGIPKRKWCKNLQWEDIKEKYGDLRLYAATTERVQEVLSKYGCLSIGYCINCGRPARYITRGYILYICDQCASHYECKDDNLDRLTAEDIPHYYTYDGNGGEIEETPIERFGIDFSELWGLEGGATECAAKE